MTREGTFRLTITLSVIILGLLVVLSFVTLAWKSFPVFRAIGISFLFSQSWDPVSGLFGALPFLAGTLITSFIALIISFPFSLAIAIFLGEYFSSGWLSSFFKSMVDLIAAVPSVIYGFWGLFFLVPIVRDLESKMGIMPYGVGIFTAALVLSIMIIPNAASISRDVIELTPATLKEAALAMGATRFELIRRVVLPYARSGIFAGVLLSLGRALGETMAVTMVIGNTNALPANPFSPGNTIASVIANELAEAVSDLHVSSLIALGLILLIITAILNYFGTLIIKKLSVKA